MKTHVPLPAPAQEEKRKQAVRLRNKGLAYLETSELIGVSELSVGKWIRAYNAQGIAALNSKTRGRKLGTGLV